MSTGDEGEASPGAPRALRRDARRNRELLIDAARELIAERGLGVGLNEIAHRAGVGVGTVYRRFPDRQDLIEAALAQPIREMEAVVERAVAAERGWDGLRLLLTRGAELLAANLGLREAALAPEAGTIVVVDVEGYGWNEVGDVLRVRAIADGDLRPDVTNDDVRLLLWMVSELAIHSQHVAPELYRRYLQVLLDGLRSGPEREPFVVQLTPEVGDAVAAHWAGR